MEFTEAEFRAAKRTATGVARMNRNYIDYDDILGAIYEWMVSNYERVVEMRQEQPGYVATAMYRAGLRYVYEERKRRTGSETGDLYFYNATQILELLPHIWDYEDWYMTASAPNYIRSGGSAKPAEGNNMLAMLVDVSSAVYALPTQDQTMLRMRYEDNMDWDRIGMFFEMTEDGVRKWDLRLRRKIVKSLGGEAPWWGGPGSRKARSNASAQSEVRQ